MKPNLKLCIAITICCVGLSTFAQGVLPFRFTDDFANRTVIFGPDYWISGSLSNATIEAGEPFIDGISSGQTVWGTWTAPSNGIVTLSANAGTFSPLLEIYTGNDLSNLSLIASNNYLTCYEHAECGCHWRERNQITFHVARGQAYQICVDSAIITDASWVLQNVPVGNPVPAGAIWALLQEFGSGYWSLYVPVLTTNVPAGGDVQLGLQFTPAPKNDDFEQRIKLQGSRLHLLTSNAGATKQPGEPDHLENPGGSSVWFSWTAPASGRVTLSTNEVPAYPPPSSSGGGVTIISIGWPGPPPTCGNEIDQNPPPIFYPVFAAYTGTAVNSLTPANCLPVSLDAFPNAVEFDTVKGQTYQIAFDGNMGTTGDIPLYLALTKPASNDNFKNRIKLHGIDVVATGYNAGATHEPGEPAIGDSIGKTVWWSWTAPVGGTVSIDLSGSDYSFPVAVFAGSSLARLRMVATDSGGVTFEAVEGQTYQIAVGDDAGITGAIKLELQAPIVDLPLFQTVRRPANSALLRYPASAGQVILLLRSDDGANWQNVRTGVANRGMVEFLVRPAPDGDGPYYRAIVVDRLF
jgi:hypothetical protein